MAKGWFRVDKFSGSQADFALNIIYLIMRKRLTLSNAP